MSSHILQNSDNYNDIYSHNTHEIFAKYTAIINEYISQYTENIKIKNIDYYNYVLNKGIETLCHIFKTILLYTKNLNITYIQCQKAVYYYIEFICQIGESSHSFLQLNSKDATLFVYKKTIFELNNEIIKEFTAIIGTCSILTNIELLTTIYNKTIVAVCNSCNPNNCELINYDHENNNANNANNTNANNANANANNANANDDRISNIITFKNKLVKNISYYTTELSKNLLNLHLDCTDKNYEDKLHTTTTFNSFILSTEHENTSKYIIEFTKQLSKHNLENMSLKKKLTHSKNIQYFTDREYKKYISWLININN